MDKRIILNGEDITEKLDLISCNLFDRLGGMLDNIKLQFPYDSTITFNKFDELEIEADKYKTGVMYITGCNGVDNNTACMITAVSGKPTNRNKRSRMITNVTLYQLINDVASSCGVGVKLYDVIDYTYESVYQMNETDLQFLNRICQREGYSIKLDNGSLVVFNDYSLENNYTPAALKKEQVSLSNFTRLENGLRSVTVKHYSTEKQKLIQFTASDKNVDGGTDTVVEYLASISEAERFSKGYLRARNNKSLSGNLIMEFNTDLSAGTTLDLTDFEEYDGRYIIYDIRHDIVNEKTHLKIRKTLEY